MNRFVEVLNLPLAYHIVAGAFIRLFLIVYGNYHDNIYELPYTDVDYRVFTDAARHVLNGDSPYKRHTYRYSPIIAYLMIPNIVVGKEFGKLLFSGFDLLITFAVKSIVEQQLKQVKNASRIATYCSLFWLYNPMSIGISTRGNADSIPCFFIILSLLFLQTKLVKESLKYVLSGAMLGIAIHMRIYPLVFSFPMYLSLGVTNIKRNIGIKELFVMLLPNRKQLHLTLSCITTLYILTHGLYTYYGYEFLFETYIYHLFRKDTRHNFSVLFYYSYLIMDEVVFDVVKVVVHTLEFFVLVVISLAFGCNQKTLPFALFSQAVVLVAFNSVMTSQYFIWFLSLLPLVIHNFKLTRAKGLLLTIIWITAQMAWLFYAYLLEFKSRDVFILIWLKSVVFLCSNVFVLGHLIKSYSPAHGFGQVLFVVSRDFKNK